MRGYGIRLFFFFQSIAQVNEAFGDRANRFLDNIGTQFFFGVNAWESAEAISKRCGDATAFVQSLNDTKSFSRPTGGFSKESQGSISTSRSITTSEVGRPLFRPDEVLRLSDEVGLLFHRNLPVVPVKLLRYYREWEFRWGGTGRDSSGWVFKAGLLAASALLCSLCLLAVANDPPKLQTPVNPYQTPTSAYEARVPGGDSYPATLGGRRSFSPVYTPPPYPARRGGLVRPGQGFRR
jgi:type IV secretion system protein VirD4